MLSPLIQKIETRFHLSDYDRKALHQLSARLVRVMAHRDLIEEGKASDHITFIRSGFACRYRILPDGGRAIIAYLVPGDTCDLYAPLLGRMDHAVATVTRCDVAVVSRQDLGMLTSDHPAIAGALHITDLVDEAISREWLVSMGRRSAEKQIAHLLCELLARLQVVGLATSDSYEFPITQADLADAAGLSVVHTNRVLQTLRAEGLIVLRNKTLFVPDLNRLHTFSDFDTRYLHLPQNLYSAERRRIISGVARLQ
ncbi:Crp/Fnr family transcriptional regulator [Methylobacterium terricola]|nr:Crp/Fnr family transcriptional regulator [Methylobacterium terricola]